MVNVPNRVDKLLQIGMYPMYIKIEAENGLAAAFQFWKLPNVVTRLDEVMVDFFYDFKDYDRNPEILRLEFKKFFGNSYYQRNMF